MLLLVLAGMLLLPGCRSTQATPEAQVGGSGTTTATRRALSRLASATATLAPTMTVSATPGESAQMAAATAATATSTRPRPAPTATSTTTPAPTPSPTYTAHVVEEEETLLGIAASYGVSLDAVLKANALDNPNLLLQGQELRIPPAIGENVLPALPTRDYGYAVIGFSSEARAIEAFSFGEGANEIVLVGGMHGGYEWNTVLLAYQMIDYFYGNQDLIPETVSLHIIPVANPDGLTLMTGREGRFTAAQAVAEPPRAARFNGNGVDLNRNWSCGWSASARWGGTRVDPGSEPFSEPETRALKAYFEKLQPAAVIFWHSQANLVAPGHCGGDAGSARLADLYAEASGYPAGAFSAYALSGTASDWLNEQGIAAATVELADHHNTASGQNLAGIFALLDFYGAERRAAD